MIAVFGLGHVGIVTAICLAEKGFEVIGIDKSVDKIDCLQKSELYLYEKDLAQLFIKNKAKLKFTTSFEDAKDATEIIVCVGTPSLAGGAVDYSHINSVCKEISIIGNNSETLKNIFFRSTVQPKTTRTKLKKLVKNEAINIFFYPEFLREGSAVEDFLNPNQTVIGVEKANVSTKIESNLIDTFKDVTYVDYEVAEMIKYANNSFHALKVSFINEIATVAKEYDVDIPSLHKVFIGDNKLNISTSYLKPGFAFGGPCLTKDTKGFLEMGLKKGINTPLIQSILPSNNEHLMRFIAQIESFNASKVLFCGITFKKGTNDIRNSPIVDLMSLYYQRPSYNKKIVHVLDEELIIESLKSSPRLSPYKIMSKLEQLDDEYDLIIFGTKTNNSIIEKYKDTHIMHLGFIL
jgi:GDP-mannose 6-dehydrogenase